MFIAFKKMHPNARKPVRAYKSVGYDVFPVESGVILANSKANIRLGFATEFEDGHVALVQDRGSTGNRGLRSLAGVVDPDYRDEWIIIMANLSSEDFLYGPDKAIAQILFIKTSTLYDHFPGPDGWAEHLSPTERGTKKLGSSDKRFQIEELIARQNEFIEDGVIVDS